MIRVFSKMLSLLSLGRPHPQNNKFTFKKGVYWFCRNSAQIYKQMNAPHNFRGGVTYISNECNQCVCHIIRQSLSVALVKALRHCLDTVTVAEKTHIPQQKHRNIWILQTQWHLVIQDLQVKALVGGLFFSLWTCSTCDIMMGISRSGAKWCTPVGQNSALQTNKHWQETNFQT